MPARNIEVRNPKSVARTAVGVLRTEYNMLADDYNSIVNGEKLICPVCGEWKMASTGFYNDKKYATGVYPICKECVMELACDYDKQEKRWVDNREKTISILRRMDLPFIESLYQSCLSKAASGTDQRNVQTGFAGMITMLKSLPQYRGKTWKDSSYVATEENLEESDDEVVTKISPRSLAKAKKRFGLGYSDEEYAFLENEYQDWITRYECNTKAQEESFQRLSMKKLEIQKATLNGDATDKLDATYQQWLNTANITPKQSASNNVTDAQTFGTLIQKYEETRPLPEVDPELKDVDGIGLLIDVFFKGHLCKMFGLKNTFQNIYEKYMKKYTVEPPKYDEEEDSESIFNKVFGNVSGQDG
jgi:hypothetical protein